MTTDHCSEAQRLDNISDWLAKGAVYSEVSALAFRAASGAVSAYPPAAIGLGILSVFFGGVGLGLAEVSIEADSRSENHAELCEQSQMEEEESEDEDLSDGLRDNARGTSRENTFNDGVGVTVISGPSISGGPSYKTSITTTEHEVVPIFLDLDGDDGANGNEPIMRQMAA